MKKFVYSMIFITVTIILCFIIFGFINCYKESFSRTKYFTRIDTVYVDKYYVKEIPYKEVSKPNLVTVYRKGLEKDTSLQNTPKDSLIQFHLDGSKLDLSLFNLKDSTVQVKAYELDLDKYKYIYDNGILTQKKKKFNIHPYISTRVGILTKTAVISVGVYHNFRRFHTAIGFSIGSYPNCTNLQKDLELSLTYNP